MDNDNINSWLKAYLNPDEYVLWSGKPGKGKLLNKRDIFLIPFSIVWFGFAVFWEASVFLTDAPFLFKLWGIPFILVGLYITVGRFFLNSYIRKRTTYVITNKKVIRRYKKKVDMLSGSAKSQMSVSVNNDGSGTISFGDTLNTRVFELQNIENVNHVQQLVQHMED